MSLRFRRSVKLAPGIRMNFSGSGVSWTLGPRGASVGIGERGTFINASFAGTGLSARDRLSGGASPPSRSASAQSHAPDAHRPMGTTTALVRVLDDGTVEFTDSDGRPLTAEWEKLAKVQGAETIRNSLAQACDRNNADIEATLNIHQHTPAPSVRLRYELGVFVEPAPIAPTQQKPRWWLSWLQSHIQTVAEKNAASRTAHVARMSEWAQQKRTFDEGQQSRRRFVEIEVATDPVAREVWVEEQLVAITWPRETTVNYELSVDCTSITLDVDLPEIEDMPTRTARPAERGFKVIYKAFGQRALEQNYARHVHGLLLRLVGEMYSALPMLETVIISGYTQRHDAATGHKGDAYVLSLWVSKASWIKLDFDHFAQIDPIEAFKQFEHRRDMTAAGKLKTIDPFSGHAT
jgi:hypothetical protein